MMKTTLRYFAIFAVMLWSMTSCSSDENTKPSAILLKKMTAVSFGTHAEYTFSYKGTKLTKVAYKVDNQTNGNGYMKYFYTGDFITEIKAYNNSNQNTTKTVFSYNTSNRLIQVVKVDYTRDYGFKSVYQYNADGSVVMTGYSGDVTTQNTLSDITEKYYFQNGEIVTKELYGTTLQSTLIFTYDSAHHPLKNVTGAKAIRIYDFITDGLFGMEHNLMTQNYIDTNGNIENTMTMEGSYNQDNYPTTIYSVDALDTTSYTFQYNK